MEIRNGFIDGLVSVIIPVYNAENFIAETLESVLNQTYKPLEIIIIDDCSNDSSSSIIAEFSSHANNIFYYKQEKNQGAAVARNTALMLAKGQYIAFIDSDDLWVSRKIEKQVLQLKKFNKAFCFTSYDLIDEDGVKIKNKIKIKRIVKYNDLLTMTMISTPSVIFDRNITGNLLMPLRRTGQDYGFWLLLLRNWEALGIDEVLVHVRRRRESLSKNKLQNIIDVYETQIELEGINKISALLNTTRYCIYALRKRFVCGVFDEN